MDESEILRLAAISKAYHDNKAAINRALIEASQNRKWKALKIQHLFGITTDTVYRIRRIAASNGEIRLRTYKSTAANAHKIAQLLIEAIQAGLYAIGEPLPGNIPLADMFRSNARHVQLAKEELYRRGFIEPGGPKNRYVIVSREGRNEAQ